MADVLQSDITDSLDAGPIEPRYFGLTKAAYTVNEAIHTLSIGRSTLYRAVDAKKLKSTKYGRRTLFLAPDLAAFLLTLRDAA